MKSRIITTAIAVASLSIIAFAGAAPLMNP